MGGTVADRLAASRRGALVGRADELAVLRSFLDDELLVLAYLHGPGGVGKSTVVEVLAGEAERPLLQVDCGDIDPTVDALLTATGAMPPDGLLVLDRFEVFDGLAPWFWRSFVPTLSDSAKVVVAGRRPPPDVWLQDPAFRECALVLPLRNLAPPDAAALARSRGVTEEGRIGRLVKATHGHPLALVIATDITTEAAAGGSKGVLLDHPDAAARLLGRFLDEAITPLQRQALHVCGHARRVDRALLREVLDLDGPTADTILAWLRERPYAESRPDGLTLHDVVKDALDHDLRWRDREAFRRLHVRVREVLLERMTTAAEGEQHRCALDLVYLHRGNAAAQDLYALDDYAPLVARPLRRDDPVERSWLARTLEEHEHRGAAAHWWAEQRSARWTVFEDPLGAPSGAQVTLRLDALPAGVESHDPLAPQLFAAVCRLRPPEPGEVVLNHTFAPHSEEPAALRPLIDQMAATSLRQWRTPALGWVVFGTEHPERYSPVWTYIGFEDIGSVEIADHTYAIWARDFGRSPFHEWYTAMADVEIDDTGSVPPPVTSSIALSRAEFGSAVRVLLKDLHDTARVRRSPLTDSRLATPGEPVQTLARRVREAVDRLARMPKLETAARAVDRTFVRPAGSQERAAEVLDLPFSTYRRHLTTGLERLEDLLWDWELHGPPQVDSS